MNDTVRKIIGRLTGLNTVNETDRTLRVIAGMLTLETVRNGMSEQERGILDKWWRSVPAWKLHYETDAGALERVTVRGETIIDAINASGFDPDKIHRVAMLVPDNN